LEQAEPSSVDASQLLASLRLSKTDKAAAAHALAAPRATLSQPVLSPLQCTSLRRLVQAGSSRAAYHLPDSVDGAPECQVALTRKELEKAVGMEATAALWALPAALDPTSAPRKFLQVRAFARAYSPGGRPLLSFHTDASDYTVNVELSPAGAYCGGQLLLLQGGCVERAARSEGAALCHSWSVAHAVTAVTAGERHSLLIFFYHKRQPGSG